jgi:hypothetical protein
MSMQDARRTRKKRNMSIVWLPISYYLEPSIKSMSAKINFAPELFPDVILTFNLNNDLEKTEKDAVLNKLSGCMSQIFLQIL